MTKSNVHLLDANVLIALATPEHSLNTRAAAWFRCLRRAPFLPGGNHVLAKNPLRRPVFE